MKHLKRLFIFIFVLAFVLVPFYLQGALQGEKVFAMCRPSISQIKNIEDLYEKDLITLDRIKLICVYHEDEKSDYGLPTSYEPELEYYDLAFQYVEENKLTWVEFKKITGKVDSTDLFKENTWTPQFKEIFDNTDGIIFTGGADIPPAIYGAETNLLTDPSTPTRNMYEISFLFHLVGSSRNPGFTPFLESRKDYPVLAICLGCQSLNVAAGGTLYQDIPSEIYGKKTMNQALNLGEDRVHSYVYVKNLYPLQKGFASFFHRIKLKKKSIFVKRMDMKKSDTPQVLTSHHQAVKKVGKDLRVVATSMDGKIVEALEHEKYKNVLGIQFHPEPYRLYMKGKFYRKEPGGEKDFNMRRFLLDNPPAMKFHRGIWAWFSNSL